MRSPCTTLRGSRTRVLEHDPVQTALRLREFFAAHSQLSIREQGRVLARWGGEHSGFSLHPETGRLVCHLWDQGCNLVRRITGVAEGSSDRLELEAVRMGQPHPVRLEMVGAESLEEGPNHRLEFRQAIVAAAQRDWHGWRLAPLTGPRPERSQVQRLLLERGQRVLPCVAVEGGGETLPARAQPAAVVAQALVWANQCAERRSDTVIPAVRLVVPPGMAGWIERLRPGLRAQPPLECYLWDKSAGSLARAENEGVGNLLEGLRRAPAAVAADSEAEDLLEQVRTHCPQAYWETGADGRRRVSVYGLDIVQEAGPEAAPVSRFVFGCGREQTPLLPATRPLLEDLVRAVGRQRVPGGNRRDPLYAAQAEAWLGQILRHDPTLLDPSVQRSPVYAQVPVATSLGLGVVDLLARGADGRLIVIELTADEDLAFPVQALAYWLEVKRRHEQGMFERLGYFPGQELSALPPRLWLVAPALRWHPLTAKVLQRLSPDVPCTCFGINEQWREAVQVVFRRGLGGEA
ncbi:MAG TPA: hypothetical protein VFP94_05960 [Terriglobales bacterium]|nr:hypothetical protein [Terriglobales bacterium]